jgi:hypothetical protein
MQLTIFENLLKICVKKGSQATSPMTKKLSAYLT